jgi:hypothetical protein
MARSGYAKGKNSGHITAQRDLKPRPGARKGVSRFVVVVVVVVVVEGYGVVV